jgi:ABC-type Fe3+-siderophore transport system permease subunit
LVAGSILAGIGIALIVSAFVFQIGKAIGVPGFIFLFIGIALLIVYFIAKEKRITPKD